MLPEGGPGGICLVGVYLAGFETNRPAHCYKLMLFRAGDNPVWLCAEQQGNAKLASIAWTAEESDSVQLSLPSTVCCQPVPLVTSGHIKGIR